MALPQSVTPVGSLERIKELHLDPAKFGSCSCPAFQDIPGRGRTISNCGCDAWLDCEWRDIPMPDPDDKQQRPRPRHVKTRMLKPSSNGVGDSIIESYVPCYMWHLTSKKRDGQNGEIVRVVGGEGDTFTARGSVRKPNAAGGPDVYVPWRAKQEIPAFPDPERQDELAEHIASAEARKEASAEDDAKRIEAGNRRMKARDFSEPPETMVSSRRETVGANAPATKPST